MLTTYLLTYLLVHLSMDYLLANHLSANHLLANHLLWWYHLGMLQQPNSKKIQHAHPLMVL